jgi:hypothetical protein
MNEYHHYCQGRVATQYCSFTQKKNDSGNKEWMAFHEETHFNSFRTLSVAVEYYKDYLYRGWNKDSTCQGPRHRELFSAGILSRGGLRTS